MGKEQAPALVTPHGFQGDQRLVARGAPELDGAFKATLILSAGRLHRSGSDRVTRLGEGLVIQASLVGQKIVSFDFHGFMVLGTINHLLENLFP